MFNLDRFNDRAHFICWVRSLPEDGSFSYMDNSGCVFASWAKACGATGVECGGWHLDTTEQRNVHLDDNAWQSRLNSFMAGNPSRINKRILLEHLGA